MKTLVKMLFWIIVFGMAMITAMLGFAIFFEGDVSHFNWKVLKFIFLIFGSIIAYYSLTKIFLSPLEEYNRKRYKKFDTLTMKIE